MMGFILVFIYLFSIDNVQSAKDSRILIIGDYMPGRLNLRSVLLGKDPSSNHDECFSSLYSLEGENLCIEQGSWLAQETLNITVIDAPIPPFKMRDQQKMINALVHTLSKEIKMINTLIIAFNQWTTEIRRMKTIMVLSSLHRVFGDSIWEHAILISPGWRFSSYDMRYRDFKNLTASSWTAALNKNLHEELQIKNEISSVFLDCTDGEKTKSEVEKFENQAQKLLNFIQKKNKMFVFKDIEMALMEIETLNNRISILINSNKKRQSLIDDLYERNIEPESASKMEYLALVACAGSMIIGLIISLIMVCIRYSKSSSKNLDAEEGQTSASLELNEMQILSQSESLGESLAYCGYSKEEIERVQKIATDSQKLYK